MTTGMICPFRNRKDKETKLKTASYEVDIGDEYLWWDDQGVKNTKKLEPGELFVLKKNSIMFVKVEPRFRLPSYIALRFNLRITHVYRGLLLGTGPLIDPEYDGPLFIPLHNLTDNDYTLERGEGLIWVEFTKLSPAKEWVPGDTVSPERLNAPVYKFPESKKVKDLNYFIRRAEPHRPIRSSIPVEIATATKAAQRAKLQAWYVSIAAIALLVTVAGFVVAAMNFVNSRAANLEQKLDSAEKRLVDIEKRLAK
jgi:deoxycytidine triphosphate deaminase